MHASLEQMRAANEERQQKQHMAEARLTMLKVPFLPSALQSMLLLSWLICNRAGRCMHPLKAMHGRRAFVILLPGLLQRTSFKWMTEKQCAQHCLMPYLPLRHPPTMPVSVHCLSVGHDLCSTSAVFCSSESFKSRLVSPSQAGVQDSAQHTMRFQLRGYCVVCRLSSERRVRSVSSWWPALPL